MNIKFDVETSFKTENAERTKNVFNDVNKSIKSIEDSVKNVNDTLEKINITTNKSSDKISDVDNGVKDVTTSIESINAPLTTMGKLTVDYFEKLVDVCADLAEEIWNLGLSFEDSSQKIRTLADETVLSFDDIQKQLLDISSTYGESIADVNEAAYQALSASVKTEDLVTMIDVAQRSAVAGFTDSATAIDGLTSVINAYGMSVDDANSLANKFLITQNLGKTTFGELASSIGEIAPNAKIAGLSIEDILSAIATLTSQGVSTDAAITQINSAINSIIAPSKEAADVADSLGIAFNGEALRSKGLIQFLLDVNEAANGDNDVLTALFGSIRGFKALAGLTAGEDKFNEALYQMQNNTTALDEAFDKMTDTIGYSFSSLKESVKGIGILTFEGLKDPIKDFVDYLNTSFEDAMNLLSLDGLDESVYESVENIFSALKDSFDIFNKSVGPELLELLINILDVINLCIEALNPIADAILEPVLSIANDIFGIISDINPAVMTVVATVLSLNAAVSALNTYLGTLATMNIASLASSFAASLTSVATEIGIVIATLQNGFLTVGETIAAVGSVAVPAMAPILLIGSALIAAAIGVKSVINELEEIEASKLKGPNFAEQANENIEALQKEKQAFDDLVHAAKDKEDADTASINRLQSLWEELDSLTDANGKIVENEERAKQIINLLNENYDMNIEYQGNMIQGYEQLSKSMESYIEKLRNESRIRSGQAVYDEAVTNYDKIEERRKKLEEENEQLLKSFQSAWDKYEAGDEGYLAVAGNFAEELNANKLIISEIEDEQKDYLATIEEYESLFVEKTEEKIDEISDYIEYESEESLKTVEDYLNDIESLQDDALDNFKESLDEQLEARKDVLEAELDAIEDSYSEREKLEKNYHDTVLSDIKKRKEEEEGKIDEEDYQRELKKLYDEKSKIESEISQYGSMDNLKTSADRKKLASLQEKLASQQEKIDDKIYDHNKELQKDFIKSKYDSEVDAENKLYEVVKERTSKEKEAAVTAKKAENEAEISGIKKVNEERIKSFKNAQSEMLDEVKNFSAESLETLTTDWGKYVDSMTGSFTDAISDMTTKQKELLLSSSEEMQSVITSIHDSLKSSTDNLSEYYDKIEVLKDIQSLPAERAASKASVLDIPVSELMNVRDLNIKDLTEGMIAEISYGNIDNSVTTTNSNNITNNYYYEGTKTKTTTYASIVQ